MPVSVAYNEDQFTFAALYVLPLNVLGNKQPKRDGTP
jgi:hypothetical protein